MLTGGEGSGHTLCSGSRLQVPVAVNDPVRGYLPGSLEREELQQALKELRASPIDVPVIINGREVRPRASQSGIS